MRRRTTDVILAFCAVASLLMPIFGIRLVKLLIDENLKEIGLTIGIACLAVWVVCMYVFTNHARKEAGDE